MSEAAGIASQLLPILGVGVGASATLLGQWLTAQSGRVAAREARRLQERQERKDAIMRLLNATQRIEEHLDHRRDTVAADSKQLDQDLHAMWLAVKEVIIVCHSDTGRSADKYCQVMNDQARGGPIEAAAKRTARHALLDQAKRELTTAPG